MQTAGRKNVNDCGERKTKWTARTSAPAEAEKRKATEGERRGPSQGPHPCIPQLLYPLSQRGQGRNLRMGAKRRLKAFWRNPGFSRSSLPGGYEGAWEERGRQVSWKQHFWIPCVPAGLVDRLRPGDGQTGPWRGAGL